MQIAKGVELARKEFYSKENAAARKAGGSDQRFHYDYRFLDPRHGNVGPFDAALNPTEQYLGSYRVWIVPRGDALEVTVANRTSVGSLAYHALPIEFERIPHVPTPFGNTYHFSWWSEPTRAGY